MCKIMTFSDARKLPMKKAVKVISKAMLEIEKDGFGYAVLGQHGVYGEKTINSNYVSRFFENNKMPHNWMQGTASFGKLGEPKGPAIFHGRTSTNKEGLINTHPMQRQGWHLIHNGVVSDDGPFYQKYTDNDSEDVLHRLMTGGIEAVAKHLTGYYAFSAIDPYGHLHVGCDKSACLNFTYSHSHDTFIFATCERMLKSVCKQLKVKHGEIQKLREDYFIVMDKNKILVEKEFKSRGWDYSHARYSSKSLGYDVWEGEYQGYTDYKPKDDTKVELVVNQSSFDALVDELNSMDESYLIYLDYKNLTVSEFDKLDVISQSRCEIMRPDLTFLDMDLYTEAMGVCSY